MMEIMGFSLSHLEITQSIITGIIIIIYAILHSIEEESIIHTCNKKSILLCDFLTSYHPNYPKIDDLTTENKLKSKIPESEYNLFAKNYAIYQENGDFTLLQKIPANHLKEHLIAFIGAPVISLLMLNLQIKQSFKTGQYKFRHTEVRKNYISKMLILFSSNILLTLIGTYLFKNQFSILGIIIMMIGLISIFYDFLIISYLIWEQQKWKSFWKNALLDIMGISTKGENHDLFNRALLMKTQIEAETDYPIPSSLAYYGIIISVVNFILSHLFHFFNIT